MTRYNFAHRSPQKPCVMDKEEDVPLLPSDSTNKYSKEVSAEHSPVFRFGIIVVVFLVSLGFVRCTWFLLPPTTSDVKFPIWSLHDAKALGKFLVQYTDSYQLQVIIVYTTTYIFLQTFAIPGSIFLSVLAGGLFNFPLALFLVCLSAGVGASNANVVASYVGKHLVEKYVSKRINLQEWREKVDNERKKNNLFNYMVFLRITPLIPNFVVNIASPMVNFPLKTFFIGTFVGVAPPSIFFINAGYTLQQLSEQEIKAPWHVLVMFFAMGFISLLPVIYKEKFQKKMLKE